MSPIIFIGGILFPALILGIFGLRSIWSIHSNDEKHYKADLEKFSEKLEIRIEAEHDTLVRRVHESAFLVLDKYLQHKFNVRRQSALNLPPLQADQNGFVGLVLYEKGNLVFPFLNWSGVSSQKNDTNLTHFQKKVWVKILNSLERNDQSALFDEAMIWERSLSDSSSQGLQKTRVFLWNRRVDFLISENDLKGLEIEFRRVLDWISVHPGVVETKDLRDYVDRSTSLLLGLNYISISKRDFYWHLRVTLLDQLSLTILTENLQLHIEELIEDSEWNAEDQVYKVVDSYVLLFSRLTSSSEGAVAIAIFEKSEFLKWQYQNLLPQNEAWNKIQTTFSSPWWDDGQSPAISGWEEWKVLRLPSMHPLESVSIWKMSDESLQKSLLQKSSLLLFLLLFSLLSIFWGSWFFWKNHQKEKRLLMMKNNFMSSITHELKTPITSIRMFAEMQMQGRVKNEEKMKEYSRLIFQDAGRLQSLVEDILSYSRMENTEEQFVVVPVNLSSLIQSVCMRFHDLASSQNVEFKQNLEYDLCIEGNTAALESLVQNLIDNAFKYSQINGQNACVEVRFFSTSQDCILEVQDNGIGIPKSEQSRIFDIFYRVGDEMSRNAKGSGLGLAIVKKIIDLHKGHISVESSINMGSVFKVVFRRSHGENISR
jgi:signal transduction histidine kinase